MEVDPSASMMSTQPAGSGKRSLSHKMGGLRVGDGAKASHVYDEIASNLDNPLPHWDQVQVGSLPNGLQYYILPNKVCPSSSCKGRSSPRVIGVNSSFPQTPPNTFDAHLRVHVGSLSEEEDQQGIAHYVEHLVFMGVSHGFLSLSLSVCVYLYQHALLFSTLVAFALDCRH